MKFIKLIALLLVVQTGNLFAQTIELKEKQTNDDGQISFSRPSTTLIANAANELAFLQTIAKPQKQLQTKLVHTVNAENSVHNFYQFLINDIPIVGADYAVHSTNGNIDFANGNIPIITTELQTKPGISYADAQKLLNSYLLTEYENNKGTSFEFTNRGLVWVYTNKTTSLAYQIETKGKGLLIAGNYYINSTSGKLLAKQNFICTMIDTKEPPPNANGVAQTLYDGTQNITTDAFNNGFRLRETRNGVNILTLNANDANFDTDVETIPNTATDFVDNDNNWQVIEHSNDVQSHSVH